jgi:hypothetical protein
MTGYLTGIRVKGYIKITTTNVYTGDETVVYEGPNLIVNGGLTALSQLIVQDPASVSAADNQIATVRFGTNTTAPTTVDTLATMTPITVDYDVTIVQPATEDVGGVQGLSGFNAILSQSMGNTGVPGEIITEVGLVTAAASPALFARQVIPSITKSSAISISVEWRVQFTS